jgi:hypothetical protein
MASHPARTRLLTSLRKQFLPPFEGPGLPLSAQGFRSLTSHLFLLLGSLHIVTPSRLELDQHRPIPLQNPLSPVSADLHLVQDSINKVIFGSLEVDEQSIVEEYGADLSSADRKSPEALKRALSTEAMLLSIENCSGDWILQSPIEVFVYLLTPGFKYLSCGSFPSNIGQRDRNKSSPKFKP